MQSHTFGEGRSDALGLLGVERVQAPAQSRAASVWPVLLKVGVPKDVGVSQHTHV